MASERVWICWSVALFCLLGCAGAPRPGQDPDRIPPATVEYLPAVIVDLDPEGRTITVKETNRYETWRIVVREDRVVRTADGSPVGIAELRIGDRVEVRGMSRVAGLITAYEVTLVERRLDREEGISPLPGGGGSR
ncbi:MAG: hypothetical protein GF346_01950 [Candidatus Eisenbacteria bacterium]|nr:hypothetical protein [Candidatus Latescibacterota bacterium]MBD3301194.1 hypothetical protein [Candidatus Eisenbacteria bacterium]